jgi:PAS domain S-box-containing protein
MALFRNPTSVPIFFARYLFLPLFILLPVLLTWLYFESERNINRHLEMSIELNNRNTAIELYRLQQHLTTVLDNAIITFGSAIEKHPSITAAEIKGIIRQGEIKKFNFLRFVPFHKDENIIVIDSPFFDLDYSGKICRTNKEALLGKWCLLEVGLPEKPTWIMASAKQIINENTGLVTGMLVGGVVLNDNHSLARALQHKSLNALFVAIEIDGNVIAANYPLSHKVRIALTQGKRAVEKSFIPTENGDERSVIVSRYIYPFTGSKDFSIILVYDAYHYRDLQKTFFRSGVVALVCSVLIFVIFTFLSKKKLKKAMDDLVHYTENAAIKPKEAEYHPGQFEEFNRIGEAVEKTIIMLNAATEELQDSKERLELTIEGAALGTWDWNIQSGDVKYNDRWSEMLGYDPKDSKSEIVNWKNLLHPKEKIHVLKKLKDHLDGEAPVYQSIHRLKNKSGAWIWVLDAGRVYKRDEAGNPMRAVGIHLDITEQKEAKLALVKERALLLSLINSIPDLIYYKNYEGFYLGCNKAFELFIGKSEKEIINKTDRELFPKDIADSFMKQDRSILDFGHSRRNDEWITYPDGKKVLVDIFKIPLLDPEGNIFGLIGVSRDVTHKRKMDEELLKIEKLESVGVLAGGIAHDFNNILTAVLGNIELANYRFGRKDKGTSELLNEAIKATRRAVKLTRQLLTFAKGEELIKEATDLPVLIKEISDFVLHGSAVTCEYNSSEDLWMADADSGQISQVIQNIVINAKHSMEDGGIIRFHCENAKELLKTDNEQICSGRFIKITISDNGSGIPEEFIYKIFDPYFTTKHKGSGLGLAISHSIISKHKGTIDVESQVGEGTTFTLFLPATAKVNLEIQDEQRGCPLFEKSVKTLFMDDEQVVRDVLKIQLSTLGHEVETAADGEEAIQKYRQAIQEGSPFEIVILDLTVPAGMGGEETAQQILTIDKDAKIVVVSGYSNNQIMDNYKDYGFKTTLTKPFGFTELNQMVRDVLN